MRKILSILYLLPLLFPLLGKAQFYNGSQMEFGKNRVQFNGFMWQYHNYERFKVYYYTGGRPHAIYAAQAAHQSLNEIEKMFDYTLEGKMEFVIYNSMSHFRQSNVGITGDEQYNIGGVTRIVGNKVFLYFEGDHSRFDKLIREGIAEVLLNQMMYGGNWREVFKNSTLLSLPDWYTRGFVSYVGEPWSAETESFVKDGILSGRYDNFYRIEGLDARYAGHSMWNYIAEVYGESVIPNILYMTRISRSVESGFLFVLGVPLKRLASDYVTYYRMKFGEDEKLFKAPTQESLPIKTKKNTVYYQFKISPDGRYAAFASNQMGKVKVHLYDISKKELKRVYRFGHKLDRLNDYSYPVINWHPSSDAFAFFEEKKGDTWFNVYSIDEEKLSKRTLPKLDKVLSFDYSDDGKTIILSGVGQGQTDLYTFRPIGNAIEQVTNDIYDDLYPSFVENSTAVIFASDRPSDTLKRDAPIKPGSHKKDIFVFQLKDGNRFFKRITDTPEADETWPMQMDSTSYSYLSDENGVVNRYKAYYDSAISHVDTTVHYRYFTRTSPVTNYNRSILEFDINPKKGRYSLLMFSGGKYVFYHGNTKEDQPFSGVLPDSRTRQQFRLAQLRKARLEENIKESSNGAKVVKDTSSKGGIIDINNYVFQDEKPKYEKETVKITEKEDKKGDSTLAVKKEEEFKPAPQALYRLNFATDNVVTQIDNSYQNQTYQRFSPGSGYFNPGLNFLFKMGISDVFEDYRVIGGFRFAGNFGTNEYLLTFQDLSKRLDKHYVFYRQSFNSFSRDFDVTKTFINEGKVLLRYPFSEVLSLRGTMSYRNDQVVTLATDYQNLGKENVYYHLAGTKAELVFDNTLPRGLNLFNGLRFKIWGEYYREFISDRSNFMVFGMDFRHYQKVHRSIIWANRFAASASLGNKRLVYYMGGVDNWIAPRFDNNTQIPLDQGYAYQTIATPMRGFIQNARNGSNMAVYNSELRVPLVKYLSVKPLKSDFLENFQVVGFFDIGTAWTGLDPYSDENSFNTTIIAPPGSPLYITLENQREPIIYGYGWGLRSRLLGYFIKFDWAWGVDDGVVRSPVRYLSLSLDF